MTSKKNLNKTKSEQLTESWKNRLAYTNGLAGTRFHNTWRSIMFTERGKKIGCEERWKKFQNFIDDMYSTYIDNYRLSRKDKTKPFSRNNCQWMPQAKMQEFKHIKFEFEGEVKTLREWAKQYNKPYNGVVKRYRMGKNYTPFEIIFGKLQKTKRAVVDFSELHLNDVRRKASQMISQYKLRDRKKNRKEDDRLTIEWMIENIFNSLCVYCSSKKKIGADRKDNSIGHTLENIVPCCYRCNTTRQDNFTHEQMLKIGEFIKNNIDNKQS